MIHSVNRVFLTGYAVTKPEHSLKKGIGVTSFTLLTIETLGKEKIHHEYHHIIILSSPSRPAVEVVEGKQFHIEGKIVTTKSIDSGDIVRFDVEIEVSSIKLAS